MNDTPDISHIHIIIIYISQYLKRISTNFMHNCFNDKMSIAA